MRRQLLITGLFIAVTWPALLFAQVSDASSDASAVASLRDGLVVGLDMFAGNGLESGASVAAGMGVQLGWMMNPSLALMFDTHGAAVGSSEVSSTEVSSSVRVRSIAAAAVQWWPARRLWIRGGVGHGRVEGVTTSVGITPSTGLEKTQNGFGSTVATGFEVYRGPLFALDLHARYADVRAGGEGYSSLLFGLGFVWYP